MAVHFAAGLRLTHSAAARPAHEPATCHALLHNTGMSHAGAFCPISLHAFFAPLPCLQFLDSRAACNWTVGLEVSTRNCSRHEKFFQTTTGLPSLTLFVFADSGRMSWGAFPADRKWAQRAASDVGSARNVKSPLLGTPPIRHQVWH